MVVLELRACRAEREGESARLQVETCVRAVRVTETENTNTNDGQKRCALGSAQGKKMTRTCLSDAMTESPAISSGVGALGADARCSMAQSGRVVVVSVSALCSRARVDTWNSFCEVCAAGGGGGGRCRSRQLVVGVV